MPWFSSNWLNAAINMSSPGEPKDFSLDALQDEISCMEKTITSDHQKIGFCHNDLQYGNIMIDEETRSITIIVSISAVCFLCFLIRECSRKILVVFI